ncbi:MAG: hypothetical protein ACR2RF_32390 [Geminicoccaceae bacterium]
MTDMVEKVAAALHDSRWNVGTSAMPPWDSLHEELKAASGFRPMARAAISALMDPTEEMVEKCQNIPGHETARLMHWPEDVKALWQAMLKAARGD